MDVAGDPNELAERIERLRQAIRYHQHRYYILDDPAITDPEFDALWRELVALEAAHPELRSDDSPTVRVGGFVAEKFEKVRHPAPMLSLANAFGSDDLVAWRERVKRFLPAERHAAVAGTHPASGRDRRLAPALHDRYPQAVPADLEQPRHPVQRGTVAAAHARRRSGPRAGTDMADRAGRRVDGRPVHAAQGGYRQRQAQREPGLA